MQKKLGGKQMGRVTGNEMSVASKKLENPYYFACDESFNKICQ
jgi:hypothetical protein